MKVYIEITNESAALCRYLKHVLPAYTGNTPLNVMSLRLVNCMYCVYGADRLNAPASGFRKWCRKWRSTHDVFHYYDKHSVLSRNENV